MHAESQNAHQSVDFMSMGQCVTDTKQTLLVSEYIHSLMLIVRSKLSVAFSHSTHVAPSYQTSKVTMREN